jgi:hypothetical protein
MATTKTFDRDTLREIRADIEVALKLVSAKHGVQFKTNGIRFTPTTFKVTLEASLGADADAAARTLFERETALTPLKGCFGRTFEYFGKTYTVCGYNRRSTRTPVRASTGGKTYRLPLMTVLQGLGLEVPR